MNGQLVRDLFAGDIYRRIEEVIKVDQTDEQIIRQEIAEYVVTATIERYFEHIFELYRETPNKPHEGVGIWVSGFFGSGKSSFAKILGLILENLKILGESAAELFLRRTGSQKLQVLLGSIVEQIPTEAVIFDVSTDRGIRTGSQSVTEIMHRLFLQKLGYAGDLDLAELEITLEAEGRLESFKENYRRLFDKDWDREKGKVVFAIAQAGKVMHELYPELYPSPDSWVQAARNRSDITPGRLAERCKTLMERHHPGKSLVFVVDEVGQFVARDVQKILDLQAVVQSLGRVGRGRMWLVVTSQEKLNELVGGLDDKRVELARLMDRFPLQVHLEPSDISEVTSRRVLSKNSDAQKTLRDLFAEHRGRLVENTRLSAGIKLPELSAESFAELYPLLPYHIDLIIQVVSGLRTQGGLSKHVGGANRTIIKLAQQLLVHPDIDLAGQPVGVLARIDQVYDLVAGNIGSEIRGKIDGIPDAVHHPLAQPAAKAICLLQYGESVHRTAENIAAALHPSVDADSRLPEVKEALEALTRAHQVRLGDDGYRIPSPAEDDWERRRMRFTPKLGDEARIQAEAVSSLWQPEPSHNFMGTKVFKAGLFFNGRLLLEGDIPVHLHMADVGGEYDERAAELRSRSQAEPRSIFWAVPADRAVSRETSEIFRSKEILSQKERGAQTRDETNLVAEEKRRLRRHQDELKRLLRQACLSGAVYFRGNDRSPGEDASDVAKAAQNVLAQVLPQVFDRFQEAAARVQKKDLEALMTTENLRGLTSVYMDLDLVRDQNGKPVFRTDGGPLAEVMAKIENRTSYGETASGRYITDEFAKEPFGWDFDVVRLFVASLLRAGLVEVTSKGQTIESALSLEARNTFSNNNLFRQASFRPKVVIEFVHLLEASEAFKEVFGREIPEIEQSAVARAIKEEMDRSEETLREVRTTLLTHSLPGSEMLEEALDQMRAVRTGKEEQAVLAFNASYNQLKEAIKRGAELKGALSETALHDLGRARKALETLWPLLEQEKDLDPVYHEHMETLADLMNRETFYRELPAIDQHARALEEEHGRRRKEALRERAESYTEALGQLRETPGWEELNDEQRSYVAEPLSKKAETKEDCNDQIPLIRGDVEACPSRLRKAVEEMMRLIDGQRVASVVAADFFKGGVETQEELDAALERFRQECEKLIGSGRKVLIQ